MVSQLIPFRTMEAYMEAYGTIYGTPAGAPGPIFSATSFLRAWRFRSVWVQKMVGTCVRNQLVSFQVWSLDIRLNAGDVELLDLRNHNWPNMRSEWSWYNWILSQLHMKETGQTGSGQSAIIPILLQFWAEVGSDAWLFMGSQPLRWDPLEICLASAASLGWSRWGRQGHWRWIPVAHTSGQWLYKSAPKELGPQSLKFCSCNFCRENSNPKTLLRRKSICPYHYTKFLCGPGSGLQGDVEFQAVTKS